MALLGLVAFVCGLVLIIVRAGGNSGAILLCAGGVIGAGARLLSWSSREQ